MIISFIGYGKITQAITAGLVKTKAFTIHVAAPSLKDGSTPLGIKTFQCNNDAIKQATVVVLAVKPNNMSMILLELAPYLTPGQLLISVASGLDLPWFTSVVPSFCTVIRAMPNIAAAIGCSATPLYANPHASVEHRQVAETLFNAVGITTWAKQESDMDAFTALSGSGPAYVFKFMQSMIEAAKTLGLDEFTARSFTLETLLGAVTLAQHSNKSLCDLIDDVTSPGGTTAAALHVFEKHQLENTVKLAMTAARDRACALKNPL